MSGKARPSLRHKTLENVKFCNLSNTDKDCITEVFRRFENMVEVVRCENCMYGTDFVDAKGVLRMCGLRDDHRFPVCHDDFCSYGAKMDGKGEGE